MNSPEHMRVVVESLRNDPGIVIAGGIETTYLQSEHWPHPRGDWSRTLDIYTYPVEPLYTELELNETMNNLVPELQPTRVDAFIKNDKTLGLGRLQFVEKIGSMTLSASVDLDPSNSIVVTGNLGSQWNSESIHDLFQRTQVLMFPNEAHAVDAARGHNKRDIPLRKLGNVELVAFSGLHQSRMLTNEQ